MSAPSTRRSAAVPARSGFTLLEVLVAFAILGLALVALADLNGGAIRMHSYAKQLSSATLLSRGKMLEVEQKLLADGPPADDTIYDGDFSDEGFPSFKWQAEIVRPRTENLSTQQIMGLLMGGGSDPNASSNSGPGGLLGSLFGAVPKDPNAASATPANPTTSSAGAMGGLVQSAMQMQAQTFIDSIGKMLREVRVTVTWPNGDEMEKLTVVTHLVLTGAGADVSSAERSTTAAAGATPGANGSTQLGQGGLTPGTAPNLGNLGTGLSMPPPNGLGRMNVLPPIR